MSVFGVLVIGSIIGTALLSSKSSEIDILNEVLKNNLKSSIRIKRFTLMFIKRQLTSIWFIFQMDSDFPNF